MKAAFASLSEHSTAFCHYRLYTVCGREAVDHAYNVGVSIRSMLQVAPHMCVDCHSHPFLTLILDLFLFLSSVSLSPHFHLY